MNFIQKINKNDIFIFLLITYSILFLFNNYDSLGFFADDGTTLYYLFKSQSFKEALNHSISFDAARDLHLIWQYLFIKISGENIIENLHFYQIVFYLINSYLLCVILKKLKFNNIIITLIWTIAIFFPAYSEVVFWIHAFTMVLISTFFFLLFIIVQLSLIKSQTAIKFFFKNLISTFLLLLSLFTYEQSIFVSLGIVFLVNYICFKNNFISKKSGITNLIIYFLIISFFILYKLNEAGFFNPNITKYQTGSDIIFTLQIFKNFILGFVLNIIELKNINIIFGLKILLFNFLLLFTIYPIFFKPNKNIVFFNKDFLIKIFLCIILFILSLIPLYFHYISDRHLYLPSFFMFIGMAYLLDLFLNLKKNNNYIKFFVFIFIFIYTNTFINNFDNKKKIIIENFKIKKFFYNSLTKHNKIDIGKEKIFLVGFPDLYNGEVFFAHEPEVNFKLIDQNDELPFIFKTKNTKKAHNTIFFKNIKNNKLIYEVD